MTLIRSRWAAVGAAVAITLGAGGVSLVGADVTSGERTVLVPMTPCRILDTRPAFQVGPRGTPLGAAETLVVDAHGKAGDCTIPSDAVGLSMNVTALGATLPTFLTIWATGATQPSASSLNPTPGQPPVPNAVITELSSGGQFSIYNLQGTVHVLADVNGYYAHHTHDDRYYTQAEVDALVGAIPARFARIGHNGTQAVLVEGRGVHSVSYGGGSFLVTFDDPVDECAWTASVNHYFMGPPTGWGQVLVDPPWDQRVWPPWDQTPDPHVLRVTPLDAEGNALAVGDGGTPEGAHLETFSVVVTC